MNCQNCEHVGQHTSEEPCATCVIIEDGEVICQNYEPREPDDAAQGSHP